MLDGTDVDGAYIRDNLMKADAAALHILNDPLITLTDEGAGKYLVQLAEHFGVDAPANRLAAVIPASATHEPHAWITDVAVPWQNAGFYLGLTLGFRIAAALSGKG